MNKTYLTACLSAGLCAACMSVPPAPEAVPIPTALNPIGETRIGGVTARGVQIYECREKKGDSSGVEWTFVAPEAELFDGNGKPAGKHYAGPQWEASDGSKIVGTVQAHADAPQADSIPWLLLNTRSVGNPGRFSAVTSVQRINTAGGTAPDGGCGATVLGRTVRVPYVAYYAMFSK